ncbi:hypothetical protein GQ44DRAFT_741368 [Phaeosphaeriaceae sp. PMI808]|nr:hypothetical protein GQ44DRAFT_741368 [Phaeosphaeriaceae sp. PMI808]
MQNWHRQYNEQIPSLGKKKLIEDAVIVGLDAEWYEHDSNRVTELGISILDPLLVRDWISPWGILNAMVNTHLRIKPNAHLANSDLCKSCPEKFQFGVTKFVDIEDAKNILRFSFLRQHGRYHPKQRAIILVGHAIENDTKMMKDRFGFDVNELGVVISTIDTQILAADCKIVESTKKIKLCDLLAMYSIREDNLHNAGNDIVCTIIAAILMISPHIIQTNPEIYGCVKNRQLRSRRVREGTNTIFCTKCDSNMHFAVICNAVVHCDHCANNPDRRKDADTHKTEKCIAEIKEMAKKSGKSTQFWTTPLRHVCPCSWCIESPDPKRHNMEYAYGHLEKDCLYRQ